jgi:hypothetical protein
MEGLAEMRNDWLRTSRQAGGRGGAPKAKTPPKGRKPR